MAISIDRSFLERVDLASLIEQRSPTRFGKAAGNGTKRTVKGPCPFCGGTDRFAVFVADSPQRYKCGIHGNGCGVHGDAIDFLRQYEHMTFSNAVATLDGEIDPSLLRQVQASRTDNPQWQSEEWQRRAAQFCKEAEALLWREAGEPILDYLRGRGFTNETIKKAHLGADICSMRNIGFVVIPWYDIKHGQYWRVTLRDIRPDVDPKKRYRNLAGSSVTDGLYLADSLTYKRPVFLVEGELDALSIAQEAHDLISVVATGTTTGSHALEWVMELATKQAVFVAFDAEEQAEKSAAYWLDALSNATRWQTPIGKDANDMLMHGLNIRLWVESALSTQLPSTLPKKARPAWTAKRNDRGLLITCSQCFNSAVWYANDRTPYCEEHWQERKQRA